jgi:hypothetical protein
MNELDQATFEEQMRWFFGTKVRGPPRHSVGHLRCLTRRRSCSTPWIKLWLR